MTKYLGALSKDRRRVLLGRVTRDLFLDEEGLQQGYGVSDVAEFITWLEWELGVEV